MSDITEELLLLYELSLAVGQSLDPRATSRGFLRTLLNRRNLTGASIWWRAEEVAGEGEEGMRLLDAIPRGQTGTGALPASHPLCRFVEEGVARTFRAGDPELAGCDLEEAWGCKSCAVIPLAGHGALLLHSAAPDLFTRRMLGQLRGVAAKLATAIQGGMAHARLLRSEAALRESEDRLRTILDNVDAYIYLKDIRGRYLFANRAVRDLWHARMEDILGQGDERFFDAVTTENIRRNDRRVLDDGETLRAEETNTVPLTGRTAIYQSTKLPLRRDDGGIYALCGISVDITRRKQAEVELQGHRQHLEELVRQRTDALLETEARASHILQSSADGLFGVDQEGRIRFVNRAAREMLGYLSEALIGLPAHALFRRSRAEAAPYGEADCPISQALRLGETRRVDGEVFWHADGHAIPVMYAVHPMARNGVISGAVVSFVDVSAQRAAAQARETALEAAEHLARVKSEFLANMSHEIRTPLNGVLGFAQIGQRNANDPAKARNAFDKILASGNLLVGVINEVLDFSKIEAGKLRIDPVEMAPRRVIAHALELVEERARARGLELRADLPPSLPERCLGDPLRLGQVLLNLLSNAVKFTETGVVALAARHEDGELRLSVTDSGIGIAPEHIADIFNPFHQADGSTTRRFGGTGLGLAISKRIVELMGGDIRVESAPGRGSRFEFRLPCVAVSAQAVATQPASAPTEQPLLGLRILVAEDVEVNQLVLEENLIHDGARVVLVEDGQAAVERVRQDGPHAYDLVLMDIQMPVLNGYEATRQILQLAPNLVVIGQTAHAFSEERDKCLACGMADHIAKPIDPEELVSVIRRHAPARRP